MYFKKYYLGDRLMLKAALKKIVKHLTDGDQSYHQTFNTIQFIQKVFFA